MVRKIGAFARASVDIVPVELLQVCLQETLAQADERKKEMESWEVFVL